MRARSRTPTPIPVRHSVETDLDAITAIYAHHVKHGTGTFETVPPDRAEMRKRRNAALAQGMPHLVAQREGVVVGFAYATIYRGREAYRFTAEDSVYVDAAHEGRGIGSALLQALIRECETHGCRQMIAVIGDATNDPSIKLHQRAGFRHAGTLKAVGFKFGQWLDTVRMQRALGAGDSTLPQKGE